MVVQLPPAHEVDAKPAEIEAGVIEDARSRHRRERWGGAVVALIAVGFGLFFGLGGGGGGGAGSGQHGGTGGTPSGAGHSSSTALAVIAGRGASASEFGLLGSGTGWAVLRNGFDITRDGGLRWSELSADTHSGRRYGSAAVRGFGLRGDFTANITATSSPAARVLAMGIVDGRAASSCEPMRYPATGAGALLLTTDAGRSWSTRVLPHCNIAASLSFVSARVGYAVQTSTRDSDLYRTVDGARRWQLVSRFPAPMAVSFGNRDDGLALVTPNNTTATGAVYRTIDGGRSWQRESFCGPTRNSRYTMYCGVPTSFGNRGVVLAIAQERTRNGRAQAFVYTTADAGRHWVRRRLPAMAGAGVVEFSPANANDLFAYSLSGVLYTSTDGGANWSSIRQPTFGTLSQIQFVSADYGWVVAGGHFEYTRDGGRTWTPVGTR